MPVDDRTRLNLHRKLEAVLGEEEANTLMAHLPPVTWNDVATTDDIRALKDELHAVESVIRSETSAEFAVSPRRDARRIRVNPRRDARRVRVDVRGEMNVEFAAVRGEMHAGFADLRGEIHKAVERPNQVDGRIHLRLERDRSRLRTVRALATG